MAEEIKKRKEHVPGTPYTPGDLIVLWGFSRPSVIRLIKDEPGVLKLRMGPKAARTCYSIPEEVEQRIRRRLGEARLPISIKRTA